MTTFEGLKSAIEKVLTKARSVSESGPRRYNFKGKVVTINEPYVIDEKLLQILQEEYNIHFIEPDQTQLRAIPNIAEVSERGRKNDA